MLRFKRLVAFFFVFCIALLSGNIIHAQRSSAQVRATLASEYVEPTTIASDFYGYSFQVPATWYKQMGVTHDRWFFYSDPNAVYSEESAVLHPPAPADGLIYVEFAVDPVPNWLPAPEVRNPLVDEWGNATKDSLIPLLPSGTWTQVAGESTLLVEQTLQPQETDGGPFSKATSVFILTERMVYYLWIAYAPPSNKDQAVALSNYEGIIDRILESFTIDQDAPAVWQPFGVTNK